MKLQQALKALASLAHGTRLAIYRLLVKRGPQGFSPGELGAKLDIPAATLSFHLKGLQHAGLIGVRRDGRFLYYTANFPRMHALVDYLTENCCSLSDEACDANCEPVAAASRRKRA